MTTTKPTTLTLQELLIDRTLIRMPGGLRELMPWMSRQQAWQLWHGRAPLGLRMAKRIADATRIPLDELAEVAEAVPGYRRALNRKIPLVPPAASQVNPTVLSVEEC